MSFAKIVHPEQNKSNFKKIEYLELVQGTNPIRILNAEAKDIDIHYLNRAYIRCLGEDCPICKNNKKIILENPANWKSVAGYCQKSKRYYVNVLDRAMARICPKCQAEVKNLGAAACPECKTMIGNEPIVQLNKVKVLSKGVQLFEQLEAISVSVLDREHNKLPITGYDMMLSVSGVGKDTKTTPIPNPMADDVVEVNESDLFDLDKTVVTLTVEQIADFQRGISLSDIFKTQRLGSQETDTKVMDVAVDDNIRDQVKKLFNS